VRCWFVFLPVQQQNGQILTWLSSLTSAQSIASIIRKDETKQKRDR